MKNKIKKASKLRQLDVAMDECTCYQCGAGTVETYEIEGTYRDAKTLKPFNQYQRVTWQSLGDDEYDFYHKSSIHYDDYAETTDGMVFKFKASEIVKIEVDQHELSKFTDINNPLLKSIRLAALFEEDVPNEIMYPDCDCGSSSYTDEDYCKNPLDKEYALPGCLEQQVLAMTSTKLLSTYFQLKDDMSNEGIDGQAPNAQPTN